MCITWDIIIWYQREEAVMELFSLHSSQQCKQSFAWVSAQGQWNLDIQNNSWTNPCRNRDPSEPCDIDSSLHDGRYINRIAAKFCSFQFNLFELNLDSDCKLSKLVVVLSVRLCVCCTRVVFSSPSFGLFNRRKLGCVTANLVTEWAGL